MRTRVHPAADGTLVGLAPVLRVLGWSQSDLARRLNLHPSTVHRWYHRREAPGAWDLVRAASILRCTADDLLGYRPLTPGRLEEIRRLVLGRGNGERLANRILDVMRELREEEAFHAR